MTNFPDAPRSDRRTAPWAATKRHAAGGATPIASPEEVIRFVEVCDRVSPAIGAISLAAYELQARLPTSTDWPTSASDGQCD